MSWIAVAVVGTAAVTTGAQAYGANKAAKASKSAANTQAAAEQRSLDYMMEREAIPQFYREQALQSLGGLYGMQGYQGEDGEEVAPGITKAQMVQQIQQDPFYMDLVGLGEDAILRNASATGGLRSGATNEALARNNQDVLRGLYAERVAGLTGMANLPSYAPQIAGQMAGIGQTQAQGIIGAAQAKQAGYEAIGNFAGQVGGAFIGGLGGFGKAGGGIGRGPLV